MPAHAKLTGSHIAIGILGVMVLTLMGMIPTEKDIQDKIEKSLNSVQIDTLRTRAVYAKGFHLEDKYNSDVFGGFHITDGNYPALYMMRTGYPKEGNANVTLAAGGETIGLTIWSLSGGPGIMATVTEEGSFIGVKADVQIGEAGNNVSVIANKKVAGLFTTNNNKDHFFPSSVVRNR